MNTYIEDFASKVKEVFKRQSARRARDEQEQQDENLIRDVRRKKAELIGNIQSRRQLLRSYVVNLPSEKREIENVENHLAELREMVKSHEQSIVEHEAELAKLERELAGINRLFGLPDNDRDMSGT